MSRNLLTRSLEQLGIDQRFWLLIETGGYGDDATNSPGAPATGGIGHLSGSIEFNIPRENSPYRSGRSVASRLSGKKDCKWSLETYIIPGTPDMSDHPTAPDAEPLLLSVFGAVDTSNPTTRAYSLGRTNTHSFRMLEEGSHFSRQAVGCVADSVTFSLPGDGKATMKFEGFAQDVYFAAEAALSGAAVATNTLSMTGKGMRFDVGSYIDVLDKDDGTTSKTSGARQVTDRDEDSITIGGAAVSADSGDLVIGYAPDFDGMDATEALLGLQGSFSTANLGTIDAQLLKAEITIKNNFTQKKQFYGTSKGQGFITDKRRSVMVKLEVLLTRDNIEFYTNNKTFVADDLTITLAPQDIPAPENSATGRTLTFNFPRVEFNVPKIDQPTDGFVKLSLEGTALCSDPATTDDEMTLTVT